MHVGDLMQDGGGPVLHAMGRKVHVTAASIPHEQQRLRVRLLLENLDLEISREQLRKIGRGQVLLESLLPEEEIVLELLDGFGVADVPHFRERHVLSEARRTNG